MSAPENFKKAAEGFQSRLQSTRDDQWTSPTPCSEWDVRALVNHVVSETRWIAPLLEGKTIAEVGDSLNGDLLGDDPKAAWSRAMSESAAVVDEPGAMQRTVHLSYGDRPAEDYVNEIAADLLIHSWDLARGTDGDARLAPDLVELALPAFRTPQMEGARAAGFFGRAVDVPDDADAQTKLLALTGRRS